LLVAFEEIVSFRKTLILDVHTLAKDIDEKIPPLRLRLVPSLAKGSFNRAALEILFEHVEKASGRPRDLLGLAWRKDDAVYVVISGDNSNCPPFNIWKMTAGEVLLHKDAVAMAMMLTPAGRNLDPVYDFLVYRESRPNFKTALDQRLKVIERRKLAYGGA
jgi:hypothetical protein